LIFNQSILRVILEMKRFFTFALVAVAATLLQGCFFGSGGSSAPAPNNVVATAKDSRVVLTWDMVPGVQYWIWESTVPGVTPLNCSANASCYTAVNVTSPASISAYISGTSTPLVNGTTYYYSINGRTGGGPGGTGSPAVAATPRLAGGAGTWSVGTSLGATTTLNGVAYGGAFVAVGTTGTSGALFSSADGKTWSASTNPLPATASFNAVTYDSLHASYVSVGTGGTVIAVTPASSSAWWQQANSTTSDLYAATNNGSGFLVATGANGTIIASSTWGTWVPATMIPAAAVGKALYGVTYGYSTTLASYVFVAVGQAGTILYSTDGLNWTVAASVSPANSNDLKAVKYGGLDASAVGIFVAVGANGTVLTSEDGISWTNQAATGIPTTSALNSITYATGRRFIAVGADGNIYYSEYGNGAVAWTAVTPPVTTGPLNAIVTGGLYDYSVVGASGVNLYSD
jgi:hypothetical protein